MVAGRVVFWYFVFGGNSCVLPYTCVWICDGGRYRLAFSGNWAVVYVATSRKYQTTNYKKRIENRVEMEKVSLLSLFLALFVV